MSLTRKQQVFVQEYLQCWNASEAARRAGYSTKTAGSIGQRLLKEVEIAAAINRLTAEKTIKAPFYAAPRGQHVLGRVRSLDRRPVRWLIADLCGG